MGRYLSQRLSQRIKLLEQINLMINTIKTQLEYCNTPLGELLVKLNHNKELNFIDECIKQYEEGTQFSLAWSNSLYNNPSLYFLPKGDKEVLQAFGNVLGTTDLNGQLNICSFYISQIKEKQKDAKERFKTYGRLYSAMGILSGATIAIILF